MKNFVVFGICAVLLLCGCASSRITASFPPGTSGQNLAYAKPRVRNLEHNMTPAQVVNLMGKPANPIVIYFYYEEDKRGAFSRLNRDNYTPLVFVNNKLAGWGWNYLNGAAKNIVNN